MEDLGVADLMIGCKCDSNAATGIANRTGIGKVRHLAVHLLWLQEKVRNKDIIISKVDGTKRRTDATISIQSMMYTLSRPTNIHSLGEGGCKHVATFTADCQLESDRVHAWTVGSQQKDTRAMSESARARSAPWDDDIVVGVCLKKKVCPLFVLQIERDAERYTYREIK